jgi:agmatinase
MDFHLDKNLTLESNCSFEEAEFGIMGVPFDSTCSYRPGCRFGPLELRKAYLEIDKPDSFFSKKVYDLGNINVVHGNLEETLRREEETLQEAFKENENFVPITLGGEHSVSYSPMKVLHEKYPDLQIVHLDAHPDLMDDYLGEKWSHATVMKRIYDLGTDNIVQYGVRTGTDAEKKIMRSLKKEIDPKQKTYVSIDIDVMEPGNCPGVGTPEPGGPIIREVLDFLKPVKSLVGFDIVEVSPPYDTGGVTSATAAKLMLELMQ